MSSLPASDARRGLVPAAVLLFTLAALCVVRAWLPEDLVVETWDSGGAQFAAFYLTLLGVGLLQESDNARRFVCFACGLLLLLAVALVAAGGWDRLLGIALAALAGGLAGLLLGRRRAPWRVAISLVVAAVGTALVFPLEIAVVRAPRDEARRTLAQWTAPDSAWARGDLGVRLSPPAGWVLLRAGSPYVPSDPAAVLSLLHAKTRTRAVLRVEPEPLASTLEAYLDEFARRWGTREPELSVEGRSAAALGEAKARQVDVAWTRDETAFAGRAVAWQDASRTLVLAAWYEVAVAEQAVGALEELRRAFAVTLPLTAQVARTADAAAGEMPQLSRRAIEILVARRPEADLPTLFRQGLSAASDGFQRLGPEQAGDMTQINRALYGGMPAADAAWMEDYLRRVRAGHPTGPEEDARGMRAMAAAVSRLPEASRERLRTILEHAITAALRPGGTPVAAPEAADETEGTEATEATEPDVDPAPDEP